MVSTGDWKAFQLDVPSIQYRLADNNIFEYKLPYSVPTAPFCTRISPMLYCCDRMCCCCLGGLGVGKGLLPFVDVVDQDSGSQLRFRAKQACCRVPRIVTFQNGKQIGHLSRTMRCCNACRVCLEDFRSKPVLQVGLHDHHGGQIARIDREGRGSCCEASCNAPMKCTGCCFTCLTCSCACRPSMGSPCCNMTQCDPVCCECCIRGDRTMCACADCPCCVIGLCCPAPELWCCCPTCETKRLPSTGTVRFSNFDVSSSKTGAQVGKVQALYRGNYPSAYMHAKDAPLKVTGHSEDSLIGMLLAGVSAGMVYNMGRPTPVFSGLTAKPGGTSPDFNGRVEVSDKSQIERLLGLGSGKPLIREDLVVDGDCVLGDEKLGGVQVHGWRLVELGYHGALISCCGIGLMGKSRAPRAVKSLQHARDLVKVALETQTGESGTDFMLRFELPDQEKGIAKKGQNTFGELNFLWDGFNPPRQGFTDQLEEVALACTCIRIWRFPCNTTTDKAFCCRCPLYARAAGDSKVIPSAWEAIPPPTVVMRNAPKEKFMAK